MRRALGAVGLAVALLAGVAVATPAEGLDPSPAPGPAAPTLIGCDQADATVTITTDAVLDPSCTYHGGFVITASNVTLDCNGANIVDDANRGRGIAVQADANADLTGVTVTNCHVEGFLNGFRVTRTGFKQLPAGAEYDHGITGTTLQDSTFDNSRGVGVYVDAYTTGTTLQRLGVFHSGSSGVYLEAGSRQNVVQDNTINDNGYGENGPSGSKFVLGGRTFYFWGIGREGVSVDGSYGNQILRNDVERNSAGGIFLYKNCGEYATQKPADHWSRSHGANDNVIDSNRVASGRNGVWVASRASEDQLFMDCSDHDYTNGGSIYRDPATGNTISRNTFVDVTYGVRVEDDHTLVEANEFTGSDQNQVAVLVGTKYRGAVLGQPVVDTRLDANRATLVDRAPYRLAYAQPAAAVTATGNLNADGATVSPCDGTAPYTNPFLFVISTAAANPDGSAPPRPHGGYDDPIPPQPTCDATWHFIEGSYRLLLDRDAESGGALYWQQRLESGGRPVAFTDVLVHSDEGRGQIVKAFYQELLGRAPDPGGLAYWTTRLRSTGVDLVHALIEQSPERENPNAGVPLPLDQAAAAYRNGPAGPAAVAVGYQGALGRAPDPGGQAYWLDWFRTHHGDTWALWSKLAASPEGIARLSAA